MNIGVDIRSLLDSNRTGVGEYTYQVLQHVINNDAENHYYLFYNAFSNTHIKTILPKFKKNNVTLCKFSYPNKVFNLLLLLKIIKLDTLINKKYSTQLDMFWFPNISFISIQKKCKYFLTIHDLSFKINPQWYSIKRRIWHWVLQVKKQIQRAHHVFTVSDSTKLDIQNIYNIPENKITTTHLGVSKKKQKYNQKFIQKLKIKYSLPEKFILSLCTLEPRKNLESLIEAFNHITNDHDLVLVGNNGWKNKKLFKQIKKSPKQNKIHIIGYVSDNEKIALYSLADLFVFPSFFEGFGLPPLESLQNNTPVITSNVSSLPEVMQSQAIYCNPYNVNSLITMINETLNHPPEINKTTHFTWEKTALQTLNVIKNSLPRK